MCTKYICCDLVSHNNVSMQMVVVHIPTYSCMYYLYKLLFGGKEMQKIKTYKENVYKSCESELGAVGKFNLT